MRMAWYPEEEAFLRSLRDTCRTLADVYRRQHRRRTIQHAFFRVPTLVLGSIAGASSIGTSSFPKEWHTWVSIGVGISSMVVTIMHSVESYMRIAESMAASLQATYGFQKLGDAIEVELALPEEERTSQGSLFLRDVFQRYQQLRELAPPVASPKSQRMAVAAMSKRFSETFVPANRSRGDRVDFQEPSPPTEVILDPMTMLTDAVDTLPAKTTLVPTTYSSPLYLP